VVADSLEAADGWFDAEDFCRRLITWLPEARGAGRATRDAVSQLASGAPWWEVGPAVDSSGNGAAMRSAPVGLAHALDPGPRLLLRLAVAYAVPTHAGVVGVAGAAAMAAGVAYVLRWRLGGIGSFDPRLFLEFVARSITSLEVDPTPERRRASRGPVYLRDRILELADRLEDDPEAVLAWTWTGAFALESVPAALFCFLRSPADPVSVLLTAANTSHDTDTIASMAGNLVGASVGARALATLRPSWWRELEDRDSLVGLGAELAAIVGRRAVTPPSGESSPPAPA
jgi:ADP-ribosylglycohydrolase